MADGDLSSLGGASTEFYSVRTESGDLSSEGSSDFIYGGLYIDPLLPVNGTGDRRGQCYIYSSWAQGERLVSSNNDHTQCLVDGDIWHQAITPDGSYNSGHNSFGWGSPTPSVPDGEDFYFIFSFPGYVGEPGDIQREPYSVKITGIRPIVRVAGGAGQAALNPGGIWVFEGSNDLENWVILQITCESIREQYTSEEADSGGLRGYNCSQFGCDLASTVEWAAFGSGSKRNYCGKQVRFVGYANIGDNPNTGNAAGAWQPGAPLPEPQAFSNTFELTGSNWIRFKNVTYYKWFRLRKVSGSFSTFRRFCDIQFEMDYHPDYKNTAEYSYVTNYLGRGDRRGFVNVSVVGTSPGFDLDNVINGVATNSYEGGLSIATPVNAYYKFDFGPENRRIIEKIVGIRYSRFSSFGTWVWECSNDDVNWYNMMLDGDTTGPLHIGPVMTYFTTDPFDGAGAQYFRLRKTTTGTGNNTGPDFTEFLFQIKRGDGAFDTVVLSTTGIATQNLLAARIRNTTLNASGSDLTFWDSGFLGVLTISGEAASTYLGAAIKHSVLSDAGISEIVLHSGAVRSGDYDVITGALGVLEGSSYNVTILDTHGQAVTNIPAAAIIDGTLDVSSETTILLQALLGTIFSIKAQGEAELAGTGIFTGDISSTTETVLSLDASAVIDALVVSTAQGDTALEAAALLDTIFSSDAYAGLTLSTDTIIQGIIDVDGLAVVALSIDSIATTEFGAIAEGRVAFANNQRYVVKKFRLSRGGATGVTITLSNEIVASVQNRKVNVVLNPRELLTISGKSAIPVVVKRNTITAERALTRIIGVAEYNHPY